MHSIEPIIKLPKPQTRTQAAYRDAVVYDGATHPLEIECDEWHLVWVANFQISMSALSYHSMGLGFRNELSKDEEYLITSHAQAPEVEWAIDNSFDGLYIKRWAEDVYMRYRLGVYLHSKQATYWKLKYGH